MIYVVGPDGNTVRTGGMRPVDQVSSGIFLKRTQQTASSIVSAVEHYNALHAVTKLPLISDVRMCLFSGNVFRHPDCLKADVAGAVLEGLIPSRTSHTQHWQSVLAYDKEAFRAAWNKRTKSIPPEDGIFMFRETSGKYSACNCD